MKSIELNRTALQSQPQPPRKTLREARLLSRSLITRQAARLLTELERFIRSLPMEHYSWAHASNSQSSIGKHVRHCLDHFDSLRLGIVLGIVDYDQRSRDVGTENHSLVALSRISGLHAWLQDSLSESNEWVEVRAMTDVEIEKTPVAVVRSTLERELHFVTSHLTHHMGIIRILAGLRGVRVEDSFGKAVSTQAFERNTD